MDAAFRAAEAHGIRAILGKVMMDRTTYDATIDPTTILERSLRESEDLIGRWHGADEGRLGYAVTPRFAISCTADMLRESAALAARTGAWWQTHVSEDPFEIAEVGRLFPDARDYVDVYDRAGGLGPRTILAHAIHLSKRELGRVIDTGHPVAHCPASNLFLASGVMPLSALPRGGPRVGLGSDVAGGPDPSIFSVMRVGAYAQNARGGRSLGEAQPALGPLDWLRMGTLWPAPERSGSTIGSDRWRPARRPTSSPSTRRTWRRVSGTGRRRAPSSRSTPSQPAHLPAASGHGPGGVGARAAAGRPGAPMTEHARR